MKTTLMSRFRSRLRCTVVVLAGATGILLPAAGQAQPDTDVAANYVLYVVGLPTADIRAHLVYGEKAYTLDLTTRSTGVARILVHGEQEATVHGTWNAAAARPDRYATNGTWNGDPYRTVISFSGNVPEVSVRIPPEKPDHMPIPTDLLRDAVDNLSGFAAMVRQVAQTGRCDQHGRTFDGLHVLDVIARTAGEESLAPDDRSMFSGRALRCDFTGRMIAGFTRGEEERQRRTLHASAWLAPLTPGGPPMPVRARFETRYFGDALVFAVAPPAAPTQ